jgi:cell division cycle 20-like protein 1 (cofactor of APC complex)
VSTYGVRATSKVTKLCDLAQAEDIVTSVARAQRGTHLAVGTNKGEVQLWDTIKCKKVRTMGGHSARVGTLNFSGPSLASGSRDRLIYIRDVRIQPQYTHRLAAHKQEVCGLKWSFDEPASLASGGNDNKLLVWDVKNSSQPVSKFADHWAAVKAIAWSPHQHGLLASGGGTADRCIRFWNTLSGVGLHHIDTGSQVCNLAWSKNCNEIVSTHGYSLNQIVVWRYPSMSKVVTLTGHTFRDCILLCRLMVQPSLLVLATKPSVFGNFFQGLVLTIRVTQMASCFQLCLVPWYDNLVCNVALSWVGSQPQCNSNSAR